MAAERDQKEIGWLLEIGRYLKAKNRDIVIDHHRH
jgi:hypothetical protein